MHADKAKCREPKAKPTSINNRNACYQVTAHCINYQVYCLLVYKQAILPYFENCDLLLGPLEALQYRALRAVHLIRNPTDITRTKRIPGTKELNFTKK